MRMHKFGLVCRLLPVFTLLVVVGWMAGTLLPLGSTWITDFSKAASILAGSAPISITTHFFLFGILGFLTSFGALMVSRSENPVIPALPALLIGGGWAVATEWYQTVLPGRVASIDDLLIDALGLAVGVMTAWLARRSIKRLTQRLCRNL